MGEIDRLMRMAGLYDNDDGHTELFAPAKHQQQHNLNGCLSGDIEPYDWSGLARNLIVGTMFVSSGVGASAMSGYGSDVTGPRNPSELQHHNMPLNDGVSDLLELAGIYNGVGSVFADITHPRQHNKTTTESSIPQQHQHLTKLTVYASESSHMNCHLHLRYVEQVIVSCSRIDQCIIIFNGDSAARSALRSRLFSLYNRTPINELVIVMNDVSVDIMSELIERAIDGLIPEVVAKLTVVVMRVRGEEGVHFHRVMVHTPTKKLTNLKTFHYTSVYTPPASVIDELLHSNTVNRIMWFTPGLVNLVIVSKNIEAHAAPIAFTVHTLHQLWKRMLESDDMRNLKFNIRLSVQCDAADVVNNWMHGLVNYSNGANNIPIITLMNDRTISVTERNGLSLKRVLFMSLNNIRK